MRKLNKTSPGSESDPKVMNNHITRDDYENTTVVTGNTEHQGIYLWSDPDNYDTLKYETYSTHLPKKNDRENRTVRTVPAVTPTDVYSIPHKDKENQKNISNIADGYNPEPIYTQIDAGIDEKDEIVTKNDAYWPENDTDGAIYTNVKPDYLDGDDDDAVIIDNVVYSHSNM